jgi:hypothetical protein
MATQVPMSRRHARRRHVSPLFMATPIVVGIIYGSYASFLQRDGGAATFHQLWIALISGVGIAVLIVALGRFQHSLRRELRAAAYGALIGGSVGYLYSLSEASPLRACGMGLGIGVATLLTTYYMFYMREP